MVVMIDDALMDALIAQASESPRRRSHRTLHQSYDDPVQRLCIGLLKGTYIRPHHHPQPNKWEMILVLRGEVALISFDEFACVSERHLLQAGGSLCGMELSPNTWHTLYPDSDEAVIMEVKEGPYTPAVAEDFATWAPEEGSDKVEHFLSWLASAAPGEQFTR